MNFKERQHEKFTPLENELIENGFIPLDKSWIIRMGFLDLINGYGITDTLSFIKNNKNLGDDIKSLGNALANWVEDKPVNVGDSATLYRFLQFAAWKFNLDKKFVKGENLAKRKITNDRNIVNYSLSDLLKLGTSQSASAAVLLGNKEKVTNPPYKLKVSYKALQHWKERRNAKKIWDGIYWDETILNQAVTFINLLNNKSPRFILNQAEDYCFARAFEQISPSEGLSRWPSLQGHESNRINEMEKTLAEVYSGLEVTSSDHRVVQAGAMRQIQLYGSVKVKNPSAVNKSWPQFWKFLENANFLY